MEDKITNMTKDIKKVTDYISYLNQFFNENEDISKRFNEFLEENKISWDF